MLFYVSIFLTCEDIKHYIIVNFELSSFHIEFGFKVNKDLSEGLHATVEMYKTYMITSLKSIII